MRQQSLFAVREIPEGLLFKPDFLTVQEERDLQALLQTLPFYEFKLHGVAAKRRVLHFGLRRRYALDSRVLSTAPEIPSELEPIRHRAAAFAGIAPDEFSQTLINEYPPWCGHRLASRLSRFWNRRGDITWGDPHDAFSTTQR
jgi:alkylated DNA repair protein (DNA oxidative demethylase)